jgi:staphylococcal nuclease domain-containing protein 1
MRDDAKQKAEEDNQVLLFEKLSNEEASAKAQSKGLWSSQGGRIENKHEISDPKAFAEEWKGKSVDAIVEHVISGDRLIARLKTSPHQHIQTLILIAGIRAPVAKRVKAGDQSDSSQNQTEGEPLGDESKQFVEERLLQRTVSINIVGVSPQGQLVGAVNHPIKGSFAPFILEAGLAKCIDHHSTMLGPDMARLRQAEKTAKEKKVGLHQGHTARQTASSDAEVTVTKIQTADTIYVRNRNGVEKRIALSSIRQPKPTDPKQSPFQAEAKEFLRKRLIGKRVRLTIDGKKPASEGYEEREVATVVLNNQNIALQLVEAGYASVIRHRRDDDDRSPLYDDLLAAEKTAQDEKKGMWSEKSPAIKTYIDFSESAQKAKVQASVLQRQKKIPAIVDFIKGPSRFTVLIPRENAKLTFVLSCIRAPKSARNPSEASEPFGQEAHDFVRRKCEQRDVEIDVEGVDKVGGFIGTLYVNRENLAKLLVEEGLAAVHAYSAEQSSHGAELIAAEKRAKDSRKGLWHDYQPSAEDEAETSTPDPSTEPTTDTGSIPKKRDYRDVVITHIDPTTLRLKIQVIGTGTGALEELMSKFRQFHISPSANTPLPTPPKTGDYAAARFSEDGTWYRARIRRNDRDAKASEILYIDYGNEEKLPWTQLRPLAAQFSAQTLKPQAQDAVLAFLQWPTAKDYISEAHAFLDNAINGKEMVASVEYTDVKDNGTMHVILFEKDLKKSVTDSVNAEVVENGWAVVKRKFAAWERVHEKGDVIKGLKEREGKAKEDRLGGWEYGDFGGDEE